MVGILVCANPMLGADGSRPELVAEGKNNINGYYFSPNLDIERQDDNTCYWRLRLDVGKPKKSPLIMYKAITLRVYDNLSKEVPINRAEPVVDALFEMHTRDTAYGRYLLSVPRGRKPHSVDISWRGEKRTLRFIESKPLKSPGR